MVILACVVKFTPARWYKGEARMLRDPGIIICASGMWFMFWAGLVMGSVFWLLGTIIRLFIGKK
jgi:hypothetical protein